MAHAEALSNLLRNLKQTAYTRHALEEIKVHREKFNGVLAGGNPIGAQSDGVSF